MAVAEIDGEYSRPDPDDKVPSRSPGETIKRMVRQRSVELSVDYLKNQAGGDSVLSLARRFEKYILEGEINGGR